MYIMLTFIWKSKCRAPLDRGILFGDMVVAVAMVVDVLVALLLSILDAVCGNIEAKSLGSECKTSLCGELNGLYEASSCSVALGPLLPRSPPQRDIP